VGGHVPAAAEGRARSVSGGAEVPSSAVARKSSVGPEPRGGPTGSALGAKGEKAKAVSEKEKHLLAQIKELERQLLKEKQQKREKAKTKERPDRQRLIVCSQWLPYELQRSADGRLEVGPPSKHHAAHEGMAQRLDVTWVGCPSEAVPEEEQPALRDEFAARQCVPVFLPAELLQQMEGIASEVLWPLFHYIPLSMLDSHIDLIHKPWAAYTEYNRAFADLALKLAQPTDLVWVHGGDPHPHTPLVWPAAPPCVHAVRARRIHPRCTTTT